VTHEELSVFLRHLFREQVCRPCMLAALTGLCLQACIRFRHGYLAVRWAAAVCILSMPTNERPAATSSGTAVLAGCFASSWPQQVKQIVDTLRAQQAALLRQRQGDPDLLPLTEAMATAAVATTPRKGGSPRGSARVRLPQEGRAPGSAASGPRHAPHVPDDV
jgi:hypothetical protein